MVVSRAIATFLVLALAACSVGEIGSGVTPAVDAPPVPIDTPPGATDGSAVPIDTPPSDDPAATYTAMIKPLFAAKACTGCHPSQNPPDLSKFEKIDKKYLVKGGTSKLLTKGNHQGITYLPADQLMTISTWLDSLPDQ